MTRPRPALPPVPRWHVAALVTITLLGLLRGLFWVVVVEVPSPIDEAQHAAYVASLVSRARPPIVGTHTLPPQLLRLFKSSPTSAFGRIPVSVDRPHEWGAVAQSYEGVQPPLFYLLLAPVQLLAGDGGGVATLYALRVMTLVLALTAVPVAYVLARELLPDRPVAWLAAPLLLVHVQGFEGNLAAVTNDALVVPLGGAALLPVARALRVGPTLRQAVAAGLLSGAALLAKATAVGLAVLVPAGVALAALRHPRPARLLPWLAVAGVLAAALPAPWVAWNVRVYGAASAARYAEGITGSLQVHAPVDTLAGLAQHVERASLGFWDLQLLAPAWNRYVLAWWGALVVAVATGAAVTVARRHGATAGRLLWLASAPLAAFVAMLAVIVVVLGGGTMVGRHLYAALVATVVAVAGGLAVALPRRWAVVATAAVLVLVTSMEIASVNRYVTATYLPGLVAPDLAPVADQTWNDRWLEGARLRVVPPCRAAAVTLTFAGEPPAQLRLDDGRWAVRADVDVHPAGFQVGRYRLPSAPATPFVLDVPADTSVGWSLQDRSPHMQLLDRGGDPVAAVLCRVEDPAAVGFATTFRPLHPDQVTLGRARGWPVAWAWGARGGLLAAVVWVLWEWRRQESRSRRNLPV
ncbi:MAG TPA: hypothetical protein VHF25_05995 [Nitriliruptorales bacterium]|nr:hypothetical protein [Nitriliruptorales bacterium]